MNWDLYYPKKYSPSPEEHWGTSSSVPEGLSGFLVAIDVIILSPWKVRTLFWGSLSLSAEDKCSLNVKSNAKTRSFITTHTDNKGTRHGSPRRIPEAWWPNQLTIKSTVLYNLFFISCSLKRAMWILIKS